MKHEILIAIIAASSVLSGVIISQAMSLIQTFLNRKHQKQKLLRQKYEEMMFHFSDSLQNQGDVDENSDFTWLANGTDRLEVTYERDRC